MPNNLSPKIWGSALWTSIHAIIYTYPDNPTNEDKEKYKNFLVLLGDLLPCCSCRESYKEFTKEKGILELNDDVFKNKKTLMEWGYNIHNKVNNKLGVNFDLSLSDVTKRWNIYCNENDESKVLKLAHTKDIPVKLISKELMNKYINLAKKRNIEEIYLKFVNINTKDKFSEEWQNRNRKCDEVIKFMQENNIPSIEIEGVYKNSPTISELKLILMSASNLTDEQLNSINKGINKIKKYKLIK